MLQLQVVMTESYDEETSTFIEETRLLKLEHSLVSLSKWESKYEKPFLAQDNKSDEEVLDYIRMMDLETETPPEVFDKLTNEHYLEINKHINSKSTATWFTKTEKRKGARQVVTSELIYYWMTSYEIPWDAETWHLNRLFTLIEVFNEERGSQDKKPKQGEQSLAAQRRALNEQRKRELNTSG